MTEIVPINVQTSLEVCNSLSSTLKKSFGPNALQVLYTTSTGKVLLTSDGSTILSALNISHPIGRWIIDRVLTFHTHHGDHAKTFILHVGNILGGISHELGNMAKGIDRNNKCSDEKTRDSIVNLGKAFSIIARTTFSQKVIPAVIEKCITISSTDWEAINSVIPNIIHTHLAGKLNPKQCNFLCILLWDFIKGFGRNTCTDLTLLSNILPHLLDSFEIINTEVAGLPVNSSFIMDGTVLSRDISNSVSQGTPDWARKFVILGFDPSKSSPESSATIVARTVDDLVLNMQYSRSQVAQFVDLLVKNDVTLVLCSECLPAMILSRLQRASVLVVHSVPVEELQRLSTVTNTDILHECPSMLEAPAIGSVKRVKRVVLGHRRFIQLILEDHVHSKHLVLCAPSEGMCRVVSQAIVNAIRCLRAWLESDQVVLHTDIRTNLKNCEQSEHCILNTTSSNDRDGGCIQQDFYVMSGGGAAELIASDLLYHEHLAYKDDHYQSIALKIISQSLLCVPRTIFQNSFAAMSKDRHSLFSIVDDIRSRHQNGEKGALGIDGEQGISSSLSEKGIVEPVTSKFILWCNVIETVIELLRMDMIIPVSKTIKKPEVSDDSDDD